MKKHLLIFLFVGLILQVGAQNIWVNEFHYDNVGTDEGEFIEIVLENAGSYNLADFTINLYNGNNGASYDSKSVDLFTMGAVEGDFTIYYYDYPSNGIQNGSPDGIAVSYQNVLIDGQFLSYEGTLTAVDGPAAGETSVDIGVSEVGADVGTSLQLSGTGSQYSEFSWEESAPETKGALNNDQSFGEYVPDPEPTNYPTNFIAIASGLSIDLTWTDATGEQLPAAYLIYGESAIRGIGVFEVPVDGTPVPDDLDWSDGEVVVNVAYGQELYSFINLEGGKVYNFTIYPYTNSGSDIDYKTDGDPPTASAAVESIVTINFEDFESGTLGTWMEYSVIGDQKWFADEFGGDQFAKMSGFDGDPMENEDWLISPEMNLTGYQSVTFEFISAMNYTGPDLQLYFSDDYDGSGDPNSFTWTEITQEATWSSGNWEWIASGSVDISQLAAGTSFLAFKYTSTSSESATWELDDLFIYASTGVGTTDINEVFIQVYPNPATSFVKFESENNGEVSILNLSGQIIAKENVRKGTNTLNTSGLNKGLYVIRYIDINNNIKTGKLVINQ